MTLLRTSVKNRRGRLDLHLLQSSSVLPVPLRLVGWSWLLLRSLRLQSVTCWPLHFLCLWLNCSLMFLAKEACWPFGALSLSYRRVLWYLSSMIYIDEKLSSWQVPLKELMHLESCSPFREIMRYQALDYGSSSILTRRRLLMLFGLSWYWPESLDFSDFLQPHYLHLLGKHLFLDQAANH